MKRFYVILVSAILLSGCATYKIQQSKSSNDNGFVVSRYDKIIPEYTLGINNSLPDKEKAEERFKRRKSEVEYYYKQMGFIENRFKQVFVEPPLTLIQLVVGVFRMPFIAVSDYKYNHNPQYKERIDRLEDEKYNAEKARVKEFKDKLSEYLKEDLSKEPSANLGEESKPKEETEAALSSEDSKEISTIAPVVVEPEIKSIPTQVEPEAKPVLTSVEPEVKLTETAKPEIQEKAIVTQEDLKASSAEELESQTFKPSLTLPSPTAVIVVKPQSGQSPLKVNFSGQKSLSPNGKVVSYSWDFGDGDKSNKPNPVNTYWSATYGTREFIATLTVTDNKGMVSSSSVSIQVINK